MHQDNVTAVFQPTALGWKTVLLAMVSLLAAPALAFEADSLLGNARLLYYESVKDKNKISAAIEMFDLIGRSDLSLQGRAQTYIGSLVAVKAKFAFWPHDKWKLAKRGLRLMDDGLAQNPDDIESLFIHGVTCYYLPKFFGRKDDAQRHLRAIVRLLPENARNYDQKIIANVIKFIVEKIKLDDEERRKLVEINTRLALK